VDRDDRLTLLRHGQPLRGESWADLGCGDGAFTVPLARELGPRGFVLAVDADQLALTRLRKALAREPQGTIARTETRTGDLTDGVTLPALEGVLLANVLHYLPDPAPALRAIVETIKPEGRVLLVEYDRRDPNPWVPHPIPMADLDLLARRAGLTHFDVGPQIPSEFGGALYAAVGRRSA
jgi:SAM-dependent methyltransferase